MAEPLDQQRTILNTEDARAGRTQNRVRIILAVSLFLAIVTMIALWIGIGS